MPAVASVTFGGHSFEKVLALRRSLQQPPSEEKPGLTQERPPSLKWKAGIFLERLYFLSNSDSTPLATVTVEAEPEADSKRDEKS